MAKASTPDMTPQYVAFIMARALPMPRSMSISSLRNAALLTIMTVVSVLAGAAYAAPVAPDVDILLIVEIKDLEGWLTLHQEVLAAVTETARPLVVALPARTGGNRTINLLRPKFTASLAIGPESPTVKVAIAGKVEGGEALRVVTPFQQAALEVQAGAVPNEVTLIYGLSGVIGRLLELHISRP
jgi:hypothetical protein